MPAQQNTHSLQSNKESTTKKQPNILFIFCDQLRADALGCSGGWVKTPNIDRIATEGVRFSNCVTNSPVCIPARVSLATGLYPHETNVWDNGPFDMPVEWRTWMQVLQDAGYRTSLFGKTHLHRHSGDLRVREHLLHGYGLDDVDEIGGPRASTKVLSHMTAQWEDKGLWDIYKEDYRKRFGSGYPNIWPSPLPFEEYADVYVGRRAKEYLEQYERNDPWFCWVSFGGPHEPWDAPEPYASMYPPESMPAAAPPVELKSGVSATFEHGVNGPRVTDPELISRLRANYAGNVTLIDDMIGEILETIGHRGEMDDTIIALTSDHGELNGDHGRVFKSCFYEGCLKVPMIVRPARNTAKSNEYDSARGAVSPSPVELIDIGPTLCELSGNRIEYAQFGRSLEPALREPETVIREDALSEIMGDIMIFDGSWKYCINSRADGFQLYDLASDPEERENLVGRPEYAETESGLRERLFRRIIGDATLSPVSGEYHYSKR